MQCICGSLALSIFDSLLLLLSCSHYHCLPSYIALSLPPCRPSYKRINAAKSNIQAKANSNPLVSFCLTRLTVFSATERERQNIWTKSVQVICIAIVLLLSGLVFLFCTSKIKKKIQRNRISIVKQMKEANEVEKEKKNCLTWCNILLSVHFYWRLENEALRNRQQQNPREERERKKLAFWRSLTY